MIPLGVNEVHNSSDHMNWRHRITKNFSEKNNNKKTRRLLTPSSSDNYNWENMKLAEKKEDIINILAFYTILNKMLVRKTSSILYTTSFRDIGDQVS